MTEQRPNIFSFATSELSQDAFLCWLASLSLSTDREQAQAGSSFLAWLWESAGRGKIEASDIRLNQWPVRQWEKVDVLLPVTAGAQKAAILIEDKTNTSQHSNQLERYLTALQGKCDQLVPIYFKTGYFFEEDVLAKNAKYAAIGIEQWLVFLRTLTLQNDILNDYREYITNLFEQRKTHLVGLWTPKGYLNFQHSYVQYEFLRALRPNCSGINTGTSTLSRGTNRDGTPWAHLGFGWLAWEDKPRYTEAFFHRIDKRVSPSGNVQYYLSTRQYAKVAGNESLRKTKLEHLKQHRERFREACVDAGTQLDFAKPSGDHHGANESEIGVLFFNEKQNCPAAVRDQFPQIHEQFVKRLRSGPHSGQPSIATEESTPNRDGTT